MRKLRIMIQLPIAMLISFPAAHAKDKRQAQVSAATSNICGQAYQIKDRIGKTPIEDLSIEAQNFINSVKSPKTNLAIPDLACLLDLAQAVEYIDQEGTLAEYLAHLKDEEGKKAFDAAKKLLSDSAEHNINKFVSEAKNAETKGNG